MFMTLKNRDDITFFIDNDRVGHFQQTYVPGQPETGDEYNALLYSNSQPTAQFHWTIMF